MIDESGLTRPKRYTETNNSLTFIKRSWFCESYYRTLSPEMWNVPIVGCGEGGRATGKKLQSGLKHLDDVLKRLEKLEHWNRKEL
jgi:hypothetical protein